MTIEADVRHGRREELGAFLRSRRARIRPDDIELPRTGRRRTPGLRREEVAMLAGIGTSWYTYLEQGRSITVTPRVLDGIGRALRLDRAERVHLYRLAGQAPPEDAVPAPDTEVPEALRLILDDWDPNPGYVLDRYWRFLGGNAALHRVFGPVERNRSCLDAFEDGPLRALLGNWEELSARLVSDFRSQTARYADDPEFEGIIGRLCSRSTEFPQLWARQEVGGTGQGRKVVDHPEAGRLHFTRTTLRAVDGSEAGLVLLVPCPESRSRLAALTDAP